MIPFNGYGIAIQTVSSGGVTIMFGCKPKIVEMKRLIPLVAIKTPVYIQLIR